MEEKIKIIYEDKDVLVLDKPAGLEIYREELSSPMEEKKDGEATLVDWLLLKYPEISKVGPDPARPGIVHRLDKGVSGLLVVAKNEASFENLIKQFEERKIKKEYIALVYGKISKDEGVIDFPIARAKSGRFAALPPNHPGGRVAITEYEIMERFVNFTLLSVRIKTGRTHQIRVHLFALGYPVVGDVLYNQKKMKKAPLDRIFLHAAKIGFYDRENNWKEYESNLPAGLKNFLETLKK